MMRRSTWTMCAALAAGGLAWGAGPDRAPSALLTPRAALAPGDALARDLFKELIDIDTTDSVGSVTRAAEAMRARFLAAGFPETDLQLLGPNERKKNLVVRLHGTGKHRPILLIGHLDVVEARREDWTTDPFQFVEKDGYFYGRGAQDMKDGDAIMVATLIRLKQAGFKPSRDIILALTADEEGGKSNGVRWLFENHRDLVDAEFTLNHDGSSIDAEHGKAQVYELTATEKVYADYLLTTTNPGGHSSLPRSDNAIYALLDGLDRFRRYQFPFELNDVTRGYYQVMSTIEHGQRAADMRAILAPSPDPAAIARLSQDPLDNSTLHTTCVATRLDAGHANNALPQRATANINCRIIPGHSPEDVRRVLIDVIADPSIKIQYVADDGTITDTAPDKRGYPPPPLNPIVTRPLETLVAKFWPGIKIVPNQETGASDAVWVNAVGIPVYQITGIQLDHDDVRMHGRDERIAVDAFYRGNEFYYEYLKSLTAR